MARAGRLAALLTSSLPLILADSTTGADEAAATTTRNCDHWDPEHPWDNCLCDKFATFYRKRYPGEDYNVCEVLEEEQEISNSFSLWLRTYKKNYTDYNEKRLRWANFAANFVYMSLKNRTTNDYSLEPNEYADWSPEEFHKEKLGLKAPKTKLGQTYRATSSEIPDAVDWVKEGAVNPPDNQGDAQSCWAFTAAAAVEGGWAKRTMEVLGSPVLVKLSPQQFVDCTGHGLDAKTGGDLTTPLEVVARNNDLCSATSYPYIERDGTCTQNDPQSCDVAIPKGAVLGYMDVQENSEEALKTALYQSGPVSVGIDGMGHELMFYKRGVLTAPCSSNLNHAVLAVGYGQDGSLGYWKVKNSWGTGWGEDGFFRLVRGAKAPGLSGQCGIKAIPTIPVFTTDTEVLGAATTEPGSASVQSSMTAQTVSDQTSLGNAVDDLTSKGYPYYVVLTWAAVSCFLGCIFGCAITKGMQGSKPKSRGMDSMDPDTEEGEDWEDDYE